MYSSSTAGGRAGETQVAAPSKFVSIHREASRRTGYLVGEVLCWRGGEEEVSGSAARSVDSC